MICAFLMLAWSLTRLHQAGDEKPPVDFLKLLVDRSTAVASAQARLTTTVTPGREREQTRLWREAALRYYERVQNYDRIGLMAKSIKESKYEYTPFEPFKHFAKATWRGRELRYENYQLSNDGGGWHRNPDVKIYREGVWKVWAPSRSSGSGRPGDFSITESASSDRALSAYLGLSFFTSNGVSFHLRLPHHSKLSGIIPWSLVLEHFDTHSAKTRLRAGEWIVALESRDKTVDQTPHMRVELGFAAEPPYVLHSLSLDSVAGRAGKCYLYPRVRQKWSQFREVAGILVPTMFSDAFLVQGLVPEEGRSPDDWAMTSLELSIKTTQIIDLELNIELPDALFQHEIPPGTHVLDEVRGEAYVVGQAGEILERTALAARDLQSGTLWWPWYTAGGALLFAIGLWLFWRWRR